MSYELSFSPEFFAGPDESETGQLFVNADGRPCTLLSAIRLLDWKSFRAACRSNKINPECSDAAEQLLEAAQSVNSCASIGRNGVPVYLETGSWAESATVYEGLAMPDVEPAYPLPYRPRVGLTGYPACNLDSGRTYRHKLCTFDGVTICELQLVRETAPRWQGNRTVPRMFYWRAVRDGVPYSGRNAGIGMALALRSMRRGA